MFSFCSLFGTCPIKLDCNLFAPTSCHSEPVARIIPTLLQSELEGASALLWGENVKILMK